MKRITPRVMAAPTRVWRGEPKASDGVARSEENEETSGFDAVVATVRVTAGAAQARPVEGGKPAPTGTASRLRCSAPVNSPVPPAQTQPSGLTSVPETTVARQAPVASWAACSTVRVSTSCSRSAGGGQGGMPNRRSRFAASSRIRAPGVGEPVEGYQTKSTELSKRGRIPPPAGARVAVHWPVALHTVERPTVWPAVVPAFGSPAGTVPVGSSTVIPELPGAVEGGGGEVAAIGHHPDRGRDREERRRRDGDGQAQPMDQRTCAGSPPLSPLVSQPPQRRRAMSMPCARSGNQRRRPGWGGMLPSRGGAVTTSASTSA